MDGAHERTCGCQPPSREHLLLETWLLRLSALSKPARARVSRSSSTGLLSRRMEIIKLGRQLWQISQAKQLVDPAHLLQIGPRGRPCQVVDAASADAERLRLVADAEFTSRSAGARGRENATPVATSLDHAIRA